MNKKLKTLAEHNAEIFDFLHKQLSDNTNGIACPCCGEELRDDGDIIFPTNPAKKPVACMNCNWTGTRLFL